MPWYPGEAVGTITLDKRRGKTVLTHTIRYESRVARDVVLQTPMEHGVALGYDRLQKLLVSKIREKEKEMSNGSTKAAQPRNIGRSILALFAGFVAAVVLSLGTDFALHAVGVWPALGQPMSAQLLMLATVYRTVYGVVSAYIVARLAPRRPLEHALIGGAIGTVLSIGGAVATWNRGLGPHWYPVALIFVALPSAWCGGRLRLTQLGRQATVWTPWFRGQARKPQ